jgi:peptide chain release factor 1
MLHPAVRATLEGEARRTAELQELLSRPDTARDPVLLKGLLLEAGRLEKRVRRFHELKRLERDASEAAALAQAERDAELRALASEEATALAARAEELSAKLQSELLARHRFSDRNIVLELRAGTGGDEASLFAADLARMYQRFAERRGFRFEEISSSRSEVGGYKEFVASVEGESVFDAMRFESGVHRVQRVPATEAQGRVHTSTATVAVLPEPEDVEVELRESDLRIDTFRAGGPGGQAVNKTSSAIRVTHLPTGLVVICQDERSQSRNKAKALKTLRSRLFEVQQERSRSELASDRRGQIGTGERSEKIRTYNFPQDRVTDHRVKQNFHPLSAILDGQLDPIVEALRRHEMEERLRALEDTRRTTGDRPA